MPETKLFYIYKGVIHLSKLMQLNIMAKRSQLFSRLILIGLIQFMPMLELQRYVESKLLEYMTQPLKYVVVLIVMAIEENKILPLMVPFASFGMYSQQIKQSLLTPTILQHKNQPSDCLTIIVDILQVDLNQVIHGVMGQA
jgi:hypothetical protein